MAAEAPSRSTTSSDAPRGLGLRSRPPGGTLSAYPYQAQTNAPYVRGRLVIVQLGDGPFTVERHSRG